MLSQKILNILQLSRNNTSLRQNFLPLSSSATLKNESKDDKKFVHDPEKLKAEEKLYGIKLRKDESIVSDDYVDKNNVRRPFFEMKMDAFKVFHADIEYTYQGIAKYIKRRMIDNEKDLQSYNSDISKIVGSDISAAYFVINCNGKLKFKHSDEWIGFKKDDDKLLPKAFDASYILKEIDMSDSDLYYEGLMNFQNCPRVTKAIFQRSPHFDAWFADRLTHLFPNLEYLDLTDCPKFNERGLEAFYKLSNLKTLIVTNNYKSAAFELTCMMLEDILPDLKIKIIEPEEKLKESVNKNHK